MTRPIFWIPAAVVLAVVLFFIISYINPSKPSKAAVAAGSPLTRSQSNVVQARIDKQHQRAKTDTVAAQLATAAAKQSHAAAHSLRQQAILIHHQARRHATPVPVSDSAVAQLQSQLATYGDR